MKTKKFTHYLFLTFILIQLGTFVHAQSTKGDYEYSLEGGTVNSTNPSPTNATMLIGGAEVSASWGDAATTWFLQHADGGDYLVIRYGSIGGQASWVWSNFGSLVSSAAEIAINSITAANDPVVEQYILDAEAIFFAGGDQDSYENTWKNTKVEDAINYLINTKGVPVSGTSAGMAILGESYYAPSDAGLLSSEILDNPYHINTNDIFHDDFINIPHLNNVITETHADRVHGTDNENRYGRAFGLLARLVADNGSQIPSYAIVCEEAAHVCIDGNGIAKVFGNGTTDGADAYFLQTNGVIPETIQSGSALVWNNNGEAVKAYHIKGETTGSGSFNLNDWLTASGGDWEDWYTTGGLSGFNYIGGTCSDCTGANPPSGGTSCTVPSDLSSVNITVSTADLSWSLTGAASYDLRYKIASETNWTQINLSANSTTVTALTPSTNYEFQVRGICSADTSNFSPSSSFTTSSNVLYCSAEGENTSHEWIADVSLGDLSKSSGANGYSDFTNITANLTIGTSYNISLTPGFSDSSADEYWKIWIDLNQDGDFDDTNENVFDAGDKSKNTVTGTIVLPSGTTEGNTRMRVVMEYNTVPEHCGAFSYGEVEDYTVNISAGNSGSDVELVYSTFENGWGLWTDGGADCSLYTNGSYAYEGNNAINIQDDSGNSSSFYLTNGIDVHNPAYVQIEVEFSYYAVSMDYSDEDFWVQYYDGLYWNTVATYAKTTDFENSTFYTTSVTIDEIDYYFPTDMKIRFKCDASSNQDDIYIDNVKITGKTTRAKASKASQDEKVNKSLKKEILNLLELEDDKIKLFPNPVKSELNIIIPFEKGNMKIISTTGAVVKERILLGKNNKINVSELPYGVYLIYIESVEGPLTGRFIKN